MRILNGHDYYDTAMSWGQDPDIVFVREKNKILEDGRQASLPIYNICIDYYDIKKNKHNYNFRIDIAFKTVYLCGEKYNYVIIEDKPYSLYGNSNTFQAKSYEEFAEIIKECFGMRPESRNYSYLKNSISLEEWFEQTITTGERDFLIENRITIATLEQKTPDGRNPYWRIDGDNLKDIGFQKILDPYSVFQMISQWVGGVLPRNPNPMVEITDDVIKAQKHGFDKWTFRRHRLDNK